MEIIYRYFFTIFYRDIRGLIFLLSVPTYSSSNAGEPSKAHNVGIQSSDCLVILFIKNKMYFLSKDSRYIYSIGFKPWYLNQLFFSSINKFPEKNNCISIYVFFNSLKMNRKNKLKRMYAKVNTDIWKWNSVPRYLVAVQKKIVFLIRWLVLNQSEK